MAKTPEDLERGLRQLAHTLPGSWRDLRFTAAARQRVLERLAGEESAPDQARPDKRGGWWPAPALLAVVVMLLVGVSRGTPAPPQGGPGSALQGETVESRLVDLDGSGEQKMVSVWHIQGAGDLDQLLAVILARQPAGGSWQPVHLSPLPGGQVLPLQVVDWRQGGRLVLITVLAEEGGRVARTMVVGQGPQGFFILPYVP